MDYRINYRDSFKIWAILATLVIISMSYLNQQHLKNQLYLLGFNPTPLVRLLIKNHELYQPKPQPQLVKDLDHIKQPLDTKLLTQDRLQDCASLAKLEYNLTNREAEILLGIWHELSNKELSGKLFVSVGTIKNYNTKLYLKLEIQNRIQALTLRDAYINWFASKQKYPKNTLFKLTR